VSSGENTKVSRAKTCKPYSRNNQRACKVEKTKVLIVYILYQSKRADSSAITRNSVVYS